jgi:hypothetical protein
MAGGDLDGDLYFISWDKRLLPKKNVPSMKYYEQSKKQVD